MMLAARVVEGDAVPENLNLRMALRAIAPSEKSDGYVMASNFSMCRYMRA